MKAVVLELRNGYASVLSDDGCIKKIRNNSYEVGQVINMTIIKSNTLKKITMAAASAAAILVLGVGTWAYASPYSYISLDVNPSIEFVLNRFDRVLKIKAANEDGEEILQEIKLENLKNKTITNAINLTLSQISEQGYLSNDTTSGIVIAASNRNSKKADELVMEIERDVVDEINESYETASLEIFSVGMERVEAAKELGVTPGKLNLVDKLIESTIDPQSVIIEEWLDKPVKDIMEATKKNKVANKKSSSSAIEENMNEDDSPADNIDDKSVKDAVKDAQKAEKRANKAKKDKDDESKREAEKEAKAVAREAEKAAREATREAEKAIKEAERALKEAERALKEAGKTVENPKPKDKPNKKANDSSKKDNRGAIDNGKDNSNKASKDKGPKK